MAEPIWYYAIDDQEHGPVTPAQLKEVARKGGLRPTDLVWKQGLDDWKPARHVAGLFPAKTKAKQTAAESPNGNGAAQEASDSTSADEAFESAWKQESSRWREDEHEPEPPGSEPVFEEPPDTELESPPQTPPESTGDESVPVEEPPAEQQPADDSAPLPAPPATPPIGAAVEYRPQERMHRPPVTVGPVTLRVARLTVVISLLLLVMVQGCQSVGSAYVDSLSARRDAAEQAFVAHWENRRAALIEKRDELQAKQNKTTPESINLGQTLDDLAALDQEMANERSTLEETDWRMLDVEARRAAASQRQWNWWWQMASAPLLFFLTAGSLLLAICCGGQERWLGLALVVLAAAAVLLRGGAGL